ncbi:hypothetical protein [Azospirillum sp. TSA2s]|uniref:hypothetical protein n=1 Tax=Azospirillum sp. TSA2s TaxID=709810 RepID=UPI00145C0D57|nr:hypothetical protein [Azospirillum sp. TSA2s]
MRMFGLKGFPDGAAVPTVVLKVRARDPERALAAGREIAAGLRLEAVHIGGALPHRGGI